MRKISSYLLCTGEGVLCRSRFRKHEDSLRSLFFIPSQSLSPLRKPAKRNLDKPKHTNAIMFVRGRDFVCFLSPPFALAWFLPMNAVCHGRRLFSKSPAFGFKNCSDLIFSRIYPESMFVEFRELAWKHLISLDTIDSFPGWSSRATKPFISTHDAQSTKPYHPSSRYVAISPHVYRT